MKNKNKKPNTLFKKKRNKMLQMCLGRWDELMHINAQCAGEDS